MQVVNFTDLASTAISLTQHESYVAMAAQMHSEVRKYRNEDPQLFAISVFLGACSCLAPTQVAAFHWVAGLAPLLIRADFPLRFLQQFTLTSLLPCSVACRRYLVHTFGISTMTFPKRLQLQQVGCIV